MPEFRWEQRFSQARRVVADTSAAWKSRRYDPNWARITNVVSTTKTDLHVGIRELGRASMHFGGYINMGRFSPAILVRLRWPRVAVLIFQNGVMVCSGARSVEESRYATAIVYARFRKSNVGIRLSEGPPVFLVRNCVMATDLHAEVRVREMTDDHRDVVSYQEESFKGAVIRLRENGRAVATVFSTGKQNVVGAKTASALHVANARTFYRIVMHYRDPPKKNAEENPARKKARTR